MSVFEDYADFYDLLYQDKDYEGEARFVSSLLAPRGVRTILDLGCGTGQHAFHLAKLGYSVVGVDRSERMLARARERCASLDAEMCPRFVVGDARVYRDDDLYDAVISLFHVVSYQTTEDDLTRFLGTVARHVVRGGLLVFDLWHGPALSVEPPQVRVKRASDSTVSVVRISEPLTADDVALVSVRFTTFSSRSGQDVWMQTTETHVMRPYDIPEIRQGLTGAGFRLVSAHDGYCDREMQQTTFNALIIAEAAG